MWPFKRKKLKQKATSTYASAGMPWESNKEWAAAQDIMHRHFELNSALNLAYSRRNVDGIEPAISACNKSIDLAPKAMQAFRDEHRFWAEWRKSDSLTSTSNIPRGPFRPVSHPGYKQLAIIREREKDYREAIRICQQARKQGWKGDWDVRIQRCQTKIRNQKS